jgi:hypothetical protein
MEYTILRIVEVLRNEKWEVTQFKDLAIGDSFRMFEPDDMSPVTCDSKSEFIVTHLPFLENGIYGIAI